MPKGLESAGPEGSAAASVEVEECAEAELAELATLDRVVEVVAALSVAVESDDDVVVDLSSADDEDEVEVSVATAGLDEVVAAAVVLALEEEEAEEEEVWVEVVEVVAGAADVLEVVALCGGSLLANIMAALPALSISACGIVSPITSHTETSGMRKDWEYDAISSGQLLYMHSPTSVRSSDLAPLHMQLRLLVAHESAFTQAVTQVEKDTDGVDAASAREKRDSVAASARSAGRTCFATTIVRAV